MEREKKFYPVMLALFVVIGVLSGCAGTDDKTSEQLTATEIGKSIEQAVILKDMKNRIWISFTNCIRLMQRALMILFFIRLHRM